MKVEIDDPENVVPPVVVLIGLLSQSPIGVAQDIPGLQNETGIDPYETYDGTRENINLATGGLNLSIPLLKLPGRNGFDYSVSYAYNSQFWVPQVQPRYAKLDHAAGCGRVANQPTHARQLHPTAGNIPPNDGTPNVTCVGGYMLPNLPRPTAA